MRKVVVVHIDEEWRDHLQALVKEAGGEVVGEACNLHDGLNELQKTNPDLLITDLNLPGNTGDEIIKVWGGPSILVVTTDYVLPVLEKAFKAKFPSVPILPLKNNDSVVIAAIKKALG